MSTVRTLRRRLRAEDGMTIIELLVAVMLITVGLIAVIGTVDVASKTLHFSQRHEEALSFAQREVERLKALPYSDLALSSVPVHTSDGNPAGDTSPNPTDPRYYVHPTASPSRFEIRTNFHDSGSGMVSGVPANGEELVGGGAINPGPETFSTGTVTGKIYRFITWRDENCSADSCPGTNDSKRLTVAVVLDRAGDGTGPSKPIYVSTVMADPDAGAPGSAAPPESNPGSGTPVSAQPFFLTDTPCNFSTRQALGGHHATHDSGADTASCAAAPYFDLMPPDLPAITSAALPDFSNELSRTGPQGLALKRYDSGCPYKYSPGEAATRKATVHTWATPALASSFSTPTSGARSVLSVWTKSVDGVSAPVTLCATLRRRASDGNETLLVDGATYTLAEWPRTPALLGFAIEHSPFTIPAGERLLLTLTVKSSSGADIELLYDDPAYKSLISVNTTTPIN